MYIITVELEDDVNYKDSQELLQSIQRIHEVAYATMEKIGDEDEDNIVIRSKCLNNILAWYKKSKEAEELALDIEISIEQKYYEKGYHSALMCIEEILIDNGIIEKESKE